MDKIKYFFTGKKKEEKPKKEIWEAETKPDQINQLPERMRKSYYKMKGRMDKLEDKVRQQRQTIQDLKEEKREEEKEKAFEKEQEIKEREERMRIPYFFSNKGENKPIFLVSALEDNEFFEDNSGKEWKVWKGLMFEKTKQGTGFSFLLTNPEDEDVIRLPKNPIPMGYLPHMFDTDTLITDMRTGKVPVYIDKEGNYAPPKMQVSKKDVEEGKEKMQIGQKISQMENQVEQVKDKIKETKEELAETEDEERKKKLNEQIEKSEEWVEKKEKKLEKMKKKASEEHAQAAEVFSLDMNSILEGVSPEIRAAFFDLYNSYAKAKQREKKATIRARKNLMEKHESDIAATASTSANERLISKLDDYGKQMDKMANRISNLSDMNRRARIQASLAEGEVDKLWDALDEQGERIKNRGKSDRDVAKEELKEDTKFISEEKESGKPSVPGEEGG